MADGGGEGGADGGLGGIGVVEPPVSEGFPKDRLDPVGGGPVAGFRESGGGGGIKGLPVLFRFQKGAMEEEQCRMEQLRRFQGGHSGACLGASGEGVSSEEYGGLLVRGAREAPEFAEHGACAGGIGEPDGVEMVEPFGPCRAAGCDEGAPESGGFGGVGPEGALGEGARGGGAEGEVRPGEKRFEAGLAEKGRGVVRGGQFERADGDLKAVVARGEVGRVAEHSAGFSDASGQQECGASPIGDLRLVLEPRSGFGGDGEGEGRLAGFYGGLEAGQGEIVAVRREGVGAGEADRVVGRTLRTEDAGELFVQIGTGGIEAVGIDELDARGREVAPGGKGFAASHEGGGPEAVEGGPQKNGGARRKQQPGGGGQENPAAPGAGLGHLRIGGIPFRPDDESENLHAKEPASGRPGRSARPAVGGSAARGRDGGIAAADEGKEGASRGKG